MGDGSQRLSGMTPVVWPVRSSQIKRLSGFALL
jgi:hypothetical protein